MMEGRSRDKSRTIINLEELVIDLTKEGKIRENV